MASRIDGLNNPLKLSTLRCCVWLLYDGGDAVTASFMGELLAELCRDFCAFCIALEIECLPMKTGAGLAACWVGTLDVRAGARGAGCKAF